MLLIQILGCLLLFVVLPELLGMGIIGENSIYKYHPNSRFVFNILIGNMLMWAIFQILAVPMILCRLDFQFLVLSWCICILLLVIIFLLRRWKHPVKPLITRINFSKSIGAWLLFLAALALIVFQAVTYITQMHLDEDDSRFVAHALDAYENNRMIVTNQATGEPNTSGWISDYIKDTVSPWMLYIALIARLVQLHPTILAHTILPAILLVLSYCAYGLIGSEIFNHNHTKTGAFLMLVAFLQLFFSGSGVTEAEFTLTRLWQGKAIVAAIGIPLILLCFLMLYHQRTWKQGPKITGKVVFCLLITDGACCLMSSMGVALALALIGVLTLWYVLAFRGWKSLPIFICACLPSLIYGGLYYLISNGILM